jgi:hypothetical protein
MKTSKKLNDTKTCKFMIAWVGRCKSPPVGSHESKNPFLEDVIEGEYCEKHMERICKCGKQATHDCSDTIGPMICGAPLCDDCECKFKGI